MSFPNASIGNPVLINSMNYRCPTETFGHDKLIKTYKKRFGQQTIKKGGFYERYKADVFLRGDFFMLAQPGSGN